LLSPVSSLLSGREKEKEKSSAPKESGQQQERLLSSTSLPRSPGENREREEREKTEHRRYILRLSSVCDQKKKRGEKKEKEKLAQAPGHHGSLFFRHLLFRGTGEKVGGGKGTHEARDLYGAPYLLPPSFLSCGEGKREGGKKEGLRKAGPVFPLPLFISLARRGQKKESDLKGGPRSSQSPWRGSGWERREEKKKKKRPAKETPDLRLFNAASTEKGKKKGKREGRPRQLEKRGGAPRLLHPPRLLGERARRKKKERKNAEEAAVGTFYLSLSSCLSLRRLMEMGKGKRRRGGESSDHVMLQPPSLF